MVQAISVGVNLNPVFTSRPYRVNLSLDAGTHLLPTCTNPPPITSSFQIPILTRDEGGLNIPIYWFSAFAMLGHRVLEQVLRHQELTGSSLLYLRGCLTPV